MTVGDLRHPTIAVSPELLDRLNRQQLQAVIAHEVSHVLNGDLFWTTLLAAVYVRYDLLAQWAGDRWGGPIGLVVSIFQVALRLGSWMARLTGLAAARRREFQADRVACLLTRDPLALIEALRRLTEINLGTSGRADDVAHLCIVDPCTRDSTDAHLASHPPLSERIGRLQRLEAELVDLQ